MACTKIRTSLIILWLLFLFSGLFTIANSQYDPICPNDVNGYVSGPGCTSYFICSNGEVVSPINQCQQGTLFNELLSVCDFEASKWCCPCKIGQTFYLIPVLLFLFLRFSPRRLLPSQMSNAPLRLSQRFDRQKSQQYLPLLDFHRPLHRLHFLHKLDPRLPILQ